MTRRYDDVIDVRTAPDVVGAPDAFVWRDRLYVVRAVLGHWRERRAWWTEQAARALHGEDAGGLEPMAVPGEGRFPQAEGGPVTVGRSPLADEHEVWRVEASPGRFAGRGVYDLRHDLSPDRGGRAVPVHQLDPGGPPGMDGPPPGGPPGSWRLLRVAD